MCVCVRCGVFMFLFLQYMLSSVSGASEFLSLFHKGTTIKEIKSNQ